MAPPPAAKTPRLPVLVPSSDQVLPEEDLRARWQEQVRAATTVCFLAFLLIVILFSCWEAQSYAEHWKQTKEMLQIILPALTGLLGSSLGFYFGSRSKSS